MKKRKLKLRRFYEQDGLCYYCREPMVLSFHDLHNQGHKDNLATIEHLDDRYSEERGTHGHGDKIRRVLACSKCNHTRGVIRDKEQTANDLQEKGEEK
jgi:hypothetical protein